MNSPKLRVSRANLSKLRLRESAISTTFSGGLRQWFLGLVLSASFASGLMADEWQVTRFESETAVQFRSSLKFAPDGSPAIAFNGGDFELRYGLVDGVTLNSVTVDDTEDLSADESSLAFSPGGKPSIAYYDDEEEVINFAKLDGAVWNLSYVGDSFGGAGLVYFPTGDPVVIYPDYSNNLQHARRNGDVWESVDTQLDGSEVSLAIDPDGRPAFSYYSFTEGGFRYATFDGANWSSVPIGAGNRFSSLDFSPSGVPTVAYYKTERLVLAVPGEGGWTATDIELISDTGTIGAGVSLAFGNDGNPVVAYKNSTQVRYAAWDGSAWLQETVESQVGQFGFCGYPSLAIAPDGRPAISFRDRDDQLGFAIRGDPPTELVLTDFSKDGDTLTIGFRGEAGVSDWKVMASGDLSGFPIDETGNSVIVEVSPGVYQATTTLTAAPGRYFVRIER